LQEVLDSESPARNASLAKRAGVQNDRSGNGENGFPVLPAGRQAEDDKGDARMTKSRFLPT